MPQVPQTRQSLLIQLGKQNDEAWAEFLLVYESALVGFCRTMGLQEADARDATQEVLAAVHQKVPTWDHDASKGSFRAWLFRVARNIAIDLIAVRARRTPTNSVSQADRLIAERSSLEGSATLETEYRRALFEWAARQAKSEVHEATWQAFERTTVQGHSVDATASELNLSAGSVYTAKCRVVARIRAKIAHLEQAFPDDPLAWTEMDGSENQS